jgi:hypothetical protein
VFLDALDELGQAAGLAYPVEIAPRQVRPPAVRAGVCDEPCDDLVNRARELLG